VHHHLAYGLDDGARNMRDARRMIDAAYRAGICAILATPHVHPGKKAFDREKYLAVLAELNAYCEEKEYELELLPGAEVLYSEAAIRLLNEGYIPTLNDTRFVLIEWRTSVEYPMFEKNIKEVISAGYIPVVAHIERYKNLWFKAKKIRQLREMYDFRIQLDCEAVVDKQPFFERRFVDKLLKNRVADYIATDAHDVSARKGRMAEAYRAVSRKYGKKYARRLTYRNPSEILLGE